MFVVPNSLSYIRINPKRGALLGLVDQLVEARATLGGERELGACRHGVRSQCFILMYDYICHKGFKGPPLHKFICPYLACFVFAKCVHKQGLTRIYERIMRGKNKIPTNRVTYNSHMIIYNYM